jgi:hypothetical protein
VRRENDLAYICHLYSSGNRQIDGPIMAVLYPIYSSVAPHHQRIYATYIRQCPAATDEYNFVFVGLGTDEYNLNIFVGTD